MFFSPWMKTIQEDSSKVSHPPHLLAPERTHIDARSGCRILCKCTLVVICDMCALCWILNMINTWTMPNLMLSINRWGPYQTYGQTWSFEGQPTQTRLCARFDILPIPWEKTPDFGSEETARSICPSRSCPHQPETYRCRQADGQHPIIPRPCLPGAIHPEIRYLRLQNRKERKNQEKEGCWWCWWWRVITQTPVVRMSWTFDCGIEDTGKGNKVQQSKSTVITRIAAEKTHSLKLTNSFCLPSMVLLTNSWTQTHSILLCFLLLRLFLLLIVNPNY